MKTGFVVASAVMGAIVMCDAASAEPFRFPDAQTKSRHTTQYTCATGRILQVTYWNAANGQSFALVPVKGQQMLFVNTLSASGVKYQAGSYTWWTKGPRADLYDATDGENAPPVLSDCVTIVR
mgnify:FL=1